MRGQLNHGPNADRTRTHTPKVTSKASGFSPEVRERVTRMVHEHEQGVLVAKLGTRMLMHSLKNSTPPCASDNSPGRGGLPPPIRPARDSE